MTISGKVTDVNGQPLMGVNIYPLKNGTSYGVGGVSDFDGNFQIEFDELSADQLVKFSYIGFAPVTILASQVKNKKITMTESEFLLDEVVVTASKKKKKKFNWLYVAVPAAVIITGIIVYNYKN